MEEAVRINGGPIPPLTILFRGTDTTHRQMAEFYADQMAQIGVTLGPEYRDFARWQEMVDARQAQLFDGGWYSDYPDEQDFSPAVLRPERAQRRPEQRRLQEPRLRQAVRQARRPCPTRRERRAMYLRLEQMVEDDCPWLIIDYPLAYGLSYDWVGNRFPMDYGHGFTQHVTLDKAGSAAKRLAEPAPIRETPDRMLAYLLRKFALTVSIVFGVVLLTFVLFNVVAKDPARAFAGKRRRRRTSRRSPAKMGLDKPRFALNVAAYHRTGRGRRCWTRSSSTCSRSGSRRRCGTRSRSGRCSPARPRSRWPSRGRRS